VVAERLGFWLRRDYDKRLVEAARAGDQVKGNGPALGTGIFGSRRSEAACRVACCSHQSRREVLRQLYELRFFFRPRPYFRQTGFRHFPVRTPPDSIRHRLYRALPTVTCGLLV
jgi:hypothetical protein